MTDRSIVISGLPGSGKTTFLAAFWHIVTSRVDSTMMRFKSLRDGDATYLNEIAARWRSGKSQIRTILAGDQLVSMNLLDPTDAPMRLIFPDLAGESFRDIWEARECAPSLARILGGGEGLLLFINADRIQPHLLTVDIAAQAKSLGLPIPPGQEVKWHPRFAPTQVQLVDLLQLFRAPPINVGLSRTAIILSLWDRVQIEGHSPEDFLTERLPLLDQYLRSGADGWTWKVYGVSAQGGDYEKENEELTSSQRKAFDELMALDNPSQRTRVVFESTVSNDLTEPIAWLMG